MKRFIVLRAGQFRQRRYRRWLARILLSLITAVLVILPVNATIPEPSSPTPDTRHPTPDTIVEQGKSLYNTGQFSKSIQALQQAASTFEATGERLRQAMTLSNLSLAYQQLGQWTQAQAAIAQSLSLLNELNNPSREPILAQTLDVQGRLQLAQGHSQAALETWQQASELYIQLDDKAGALRSQINQAQALRSLGLYRQAQKKLTASLPLLQDQPASLQVTALRSLGNVFRDIGDLKSSRQLLEQSLAIAKQSQTAAVSGAMPGGLIADTLLSLGNTARAEQDPSAALKFYQQAALSASDSTRLQAKLNQLSLLLETEQFSAASDLEAQIESEVKALPPSRQAVYARINLAESLKQFKSDRPTNWETIAQLLATSLQQAKDLQDQPATSYALGSLAELYEQSQQWSEATDLTQQALYIAQAIEAPDIAYRWQWQLGRLYRQGGSQALPQAIAAYSQAVETLQSLRSDLVAINPDAQFSFREEVEPVYRQFVDLLLSGQGEVSQENLQQARDTIESLQIAELENFFRSACLDSRVAVDRVVDLDATSAVIYPIALEQRLEIIVKLPQEEGLRHYTTTVTQAQVESTVAQLRQNLRDVTQTTQVKQLSQQLYNWLIAPLEAELTSRNLETLVFILDSPLRNIPMAVLYDEGQQQYLVEKYAIALAPGLQLVAPKPLQQVTLNALMAGVSEQRSVEGREFASLDNVKQELEQIQTEVAKSKELFNQEFTETNLQSQLESAPFSVIHLATHGQFSSNPDETFILTWDHLLKVKDFDHLIRQSEDRTGGIELLVLSACKTAQGDERAALGLAGIAVRAGARSTLATLWSIDDRAATELMSQFYQEIGTGVTKAQALQHAQLTVLAQEQRPYFWAPFVLVGNWL